MKPTLKNEVALAFDPFAGNADAMISSIFADTTARTLWLLWKSGHVTGDGFNDDVLRIARKIRETKPQTPHALGECFPTRFGGPMQNFVASDVAKFAAEALPFFTGERTVTFKVGSKKSTVEQLRAFAALPEFEGTETAKLMLAASEELAAEKLKTRKVARWILHERARQCVGDTQEERNNDQRSPLPVRLWGFAQELIGDLDARLASDEITNAQRERLGFPPNPADPMISLLHRMS